MAPFWWWSVRRTEKTREPGVFAWALAVVSLILPWIAGALALAGALRFSGDAKVGLLWMAAGALLFVLDVVIDFAWARSSIADSSEPHLNCRAQQLSGRTLVVAERIVNGRGKVRAGDTVWACDGPDVPAGSRVRVTGQRGGVLQVEAAKETGD